MTEAYRVAIRMRDVGVALFASSQYGQQLNRIRLQKFIYLLDQVGQLLAFLPPSRTHYSFRRGPFDPNIQNAVDALAFRGLVRIIKLRKDPDGSIHAEYALTLVGVQWVESMISTADLSDRWRAAQLIASEIDRIGWDRIKELVYAEPTYVAAKPRGYGEQLRQFEFTQPSSATIFRAISHSLSCGFERIPTVDMIVELYFDYLNQYSIYESKYTG
jgi:hypothetical protein